MSSTVLPVPMSGNRGEPRKYRKLESPHNSSSQQLCGWCSQIELYDVNGYEEQRTALSSDLLREYFHGDCKDRHSSHGEGSFPESTCGFCRHLNVEHLVDCVLGHRESETPRFSRKMYAFFTQWYCNVDPTTRCRLCQFIARSISANTGISEIGLHFYEDSGKHSFKILGTKDETTFYVTREPQSQLDPEVDWDLVNAWPLADSEEDKQQRMEDIVEGLLDALRDPTTHGEKVGPNVTVLDMRRPSKRRRLSPQTPRRTPRASEERTMPPRPIRVIDVRNECIVSPAMPVNYVALSYVWGESPEKELKAEDKTIDRLGKPGGLVETELPPTIRDAMTVCRRLNQRYLWVDRFCILQNTKNPNLEQINQMDSIYKSAVFTIVALSSDSSQSGLAGVSQKREKRLSMLEWQGSFITEPFPSLAEIIENSVWATRGWTFQEQLCSQNLLYFGDHGVYLSIGDEEKSERLSANFMSGGANFKFPESVQEYCKRKITLPSDILRAFTGVMNLRYQDDHYFGLPTKGKEQSPSLGFGGWIQWNPLVMVFDS
ncbi:HET-domain-containing protein [Neofusicoccum parvum]|uniref:HET-domain-containing protein n=1 Tax=Neofusicoccum parvum TaxID=310453 RepID=A0ACB5SQK2_9PEZI|nr:HET-domain-containing protein [Neofusicoccum parvum]